MNRALFVVLAPLVGLGIDADALGLVLGQILPLSSRMSFR
jgi:hypothetical protein